MAEAMSSAETEATTLKKMYEQLISLDLHLFRGEPKSMATALESKALGNACYAKRENREAIFHYNNGVLYCPQDSDEALELLCMLLGNRTIVNFEDKNYQRVFDDLKYMEELGKYPLRLQYKLPWRKGRCYAALGQFDDADKCFDEALTLVQEQDGLPDADRERQIRIIQHCKDNKALAEGGATAMEEECSITEYFQANEKYPAASSLVDLAYSENMGRYAVAKVDIPIGTLVVKEEPLVATLDQSRSFSNCQYCFAYVEQFYPCSKCTNVVFCSTVCKVKAEESFHGVECPIFDSLSASFDKLVCLRLITQQKYTFFEENRARLTEYLDMDGQGLTEKDVYLSDDYDNFLWLFRNIKDTKYDTMYYNKAAYLLRVLKNTDFFPFQTEDQVLLDEEIFIGRLLLRHSKVISYNIHGINEQKKNFDPELCHPGGKASTFLNEEIGSGIYLTLALFNHACEPSIIRYNVKKSMVVRTIVPLKAGDIIYDNYGPNYLFMPLEMRQQNLKRDYDFVCRCTPCVEKWETFDLMGVEVRVPCKTRNCTNVFTLNEIRMPRRCHRCQRPLRIIDISRVTEKISKHALKGEELFKENKFDEALKEYNIALEMKSRYSKKPDVEVIKLRERIETIYSRNGNKPIF
ncbi:hypothetical protein JTB14_021036 [Gonioctena quinquepunctata]|nr:hypothetical protein JTB14_021036 [Gonioctena quinquepunctata]